MIKTNQKQGVSTLLMVIVISAVALIIAVTAALKGIDETQTGLHQRKSIETFTATDGCLEEALIKLNGDRTGYTGENLTIGDVSCVVTVTGAGNTRTINVTSTHDGTYTREFEADVDFSSGFEVTSWQELTD